METTEKEPQNRKREKNSVSFRVFSGQQFLPLILKCFEIIYSFFYICFFSQILPEFYIAITYNYRILSIAF